MDFPASISAKEMAAAIRAFRTAFSQEATPAELAELAKGWCLTVDELTRIEGGDAALWDSKRSSPEYVACVRDRLRPPKGQRLNA